MLEANVLFLGLCYHNSYFYIRLSEINGLTARAHGAGVRTAPAYAPGAGIIFS